MTFMHDASRAAMGELENRLDEVSIMSAAADAAAIARAIVRPAMRDQVGQAAGGWFIAQAQAQARALRQIHDQLESLALRFTHSDTRPGLPDDTAPRANSWTAVAWLRGPAGAIGSALARAADEVSHRTIPDAARHLATEASAWVGRQVGERSGVHDRVSA